MRVAPDRFTNLVRIGATATSVDPLSVTFAAKRPGKRWARIGTDDGAPYGVFVDPRDYRRGQSVSFVAVARASDGSVSTSPGRHGKAALMAIQPDVTTALDETGRRYAFRPAAILGNGSLLATISERGEIERLFWPNVDHGQHLGELRLGLDRDGETHWLDEAPCSWTQSYESGASVLRTTADLHGTTIEVTDFVTPAEPVLVRGIRSSSAERLVVHIAPSLDGDERSGAGYVDPGSGALVFYLRDVALAVALVASDTTSTLRESNGREPSHDVVVYRAPVDGLIAGGLVDEARVLVAFGATPDEAIARLRRPGDRLARRPRRRAHRVRP